MIWDWIGQEYLPQLAESFVDPHKRVSVGYLLAAVVVALAWGCWVKRGMGSGLAHGAQSLLGRRLWVSASARADYKLLLANHAVMILMAPLLLSKIAVTTFLFLFFHETFDTGTSPFAAAPVWAASAAFTIFLFVLDDFSRFAVHVALHRIPILWAFHKTHHSAETLTPFTVYRTHPVEGILFSLRGTLVQAVAISLFVFLFGDNLDLVSVYGVNVLLFVFNATGANLRHSHVQFRYGAILERVFMSPAQHQMHHSVEARHHGANYGAALALWDWMFASLRLSEKNMTLRFGLTDGPDAASHRLTSLYLAPFLEAGLSIRRAVGTGCLTAGAAIRRYRPSQQLVGSCLVVLGAAAIVAAGAARSHAAELNVYSHRQPFLIKPFLQAFEKETGVKVNVVFASKGLVQRLQAEGPRSPADLVLTVDIGRLDAYSDKNLFAPVSSDVLTANIPAHLRDTGNRWFGLSKRARVVAVAKDRVEVGEIKRIEDLADAKWKGRICSRPGSHVYNRALLASLIAANGKKAAEAWARGLVANLARRPQGNDRAQVKAIFQGVCDVAIINSYYFGKLKTSKVPAQREWADAVRIVFTNQQDRGNHINISGGGVARYSKNKATAIKMLEFLTESTAQKLYGRINYEYPVNPAVPASAEVRSWGEFKEDQLPIGTIATLAPAAQRIIDRVGW